jgi:hypothetical protein
MTMNSANIDDDGGGALMAVKLSRLTARLDELQEQNGALASEKESLSAQVSALQQVRQAPHMSKTAAPATELASKVVLHVVACWLSLVLNHSAAIW